MCRQRKVFRRSMMCFLQLHDSFPSLWTTKERLRGSTHTHTSAGRCEAIIEEEQKRRNSTLERWKRMIRSGRGRVCGEKRGCGREAQGQEGSLSCGLLFTGWFHFPSLATAIKQQNNDSVIASAHDAPPPSPLVLPRML